MNLATWLSARGGAMAMRPRWRAERGWCAPRRVERDTRRAPIASVRSRCIRACGTDIGAMSEATPHRRPACCPICGRPTVQEFRPFCSARCADVDLNRWLSGAYVILGADNDEEPATGGDERKPQ